MFLAGSLLDFSHGLIQKYETLTASSGTHYEPNGLPLCQLVKSANARDDACGTRTYKRCHNCSTESLTQRPRYLCSSSLSDSREPAGLTCFRSNQTAFASSAGEGKIISHKTGEVSFLRLSLLVIWGTKIYYVIWFFMFCLLHFFLHSRILAETPCSKLGARTSVYQVTGCLEAACKLSLEYFPLSIEK